MTATPATTPRRSSDVWATGLAAFAASMLLIIGMFQMLEGLAALVDDELLLAVGGYVYELDVTVWGWAHLLLGALAALTGVFLFRGALWARAAGIVLAGISAVANFAFAPYYPLWAVLIIALDIAVIWALVAYEPEQS